MPNVPSKKAIDKINQSYTQLTEQTGIAREVWSRYFNAAQEPTMGTLKDIASALGLDLLDCFAAFLDRRNRTLAARNDKNKRS